MPNLDYAVYRQRNKAALVLGCSALVSLAACGGGGGAGQEALGPAPIGSGPGSATLEWSGSGDSRVAGYRVYVGTSSGKYLQAKGAGINVGSTTTSSVSGLSSGQTYYFAVTSYDGSGNESAFSAEATKTIN